MSKNINISLDFKGLAAKARQNIGMTLWAALAVLIILEGLIVREAIGVMLGAKQITPTARTQPVRVNFNLYDTLTKRFDQQSGFVPSPGIPPSPFGTIEISEPRP